MHANKCKRLLLQREHICKTLLQFSNIFLLVLYEMVIIMKGGRNGGIWQRQTLFHLFPSPSSPRKQFQPLSMLLGG